MRSVVRVVPCLDPEQAVVVGAVIGVSPVFKVEVGEVGKHTSGSPRVHKGPRSPHPLTGGLALGRRDIGVDGEQVRHQVKLVTVKEGAGVAGSAVVGAAPRREAHLTRLSTGQSPLQVLHQRRDRSLGSSRRKNSDLV